MSATLTVSDVRRSDLALGMLLAAAVAMSAIVVVLRFGAGAEANAAEPRPTAVAVRSVARRGERARTEATDRSQPPARVEPPPPPEPAQAVHHETHARPHPRAKARRAGRARSKRTAQQSSAGTRAAVDGPTDGGSSDGSDNGDAFVAEYRSMLRRWLAAHVRIRGSAVAPAEIDGKRLRLTLEIDAARTIVRAAIVPTGAPALDRAAATAVASLEGRTLPSPPLGYPGPLQRRIPVVFVCHPGACD